MTTHDHTWRVDRQAAAQQFPAHRRDPCVQRGASIETQRPPEGGLCIRACTSLQRESRNREGSALAELLATASAVQADLLTLDFARITRHETGLLERRLQCFVVVDQRTRDAVTHSASLARLAATAHVDLDVECSVVGGQHQRLTHDHDRRLATEIFVNGLAVDDDLAGALLHEHARHRRLAAAGSVIPISDHHRIPQSSSTLGCWAVCGCVAPAYTFSFLTIA